MPDSPAFHGLVPFLGRQLDLILLESAELWAVFQKRGYDVGCVHKLDTVLQNMTSQIAMLNIDNLAKPHFKCQHCGKTITEADSANVCWNPETPDKTTVICKEYACQKAQEPREGGLYWMELDVAVLFLIRNSGVNLKRAREKAAQLALLTP